SFLVREYIEMKAEGLAGAIIMGTSYQTIQTLDAGIVLTGVFQATRGGHFRSEMVNNMALGSYNKTFEPARTTADWLTRDEAVVDAYVAEPLCQFVFTVNGYYNLFRGLRYAQRKNHLERIPKDLPVFILSGENDPVGDFGRGPKQVAEIYREIGLTDVTCKLYPEDRHELLNELDKEQVDRDLLDWLEAHM
ncbi:MAG: alpha/beta hydrolase, partial [Eubacterium sp.]|nr:alpha/beta hydrolase [Eubacterium sp.]